MGEIPVTDVGLKNICTCRGKYEMNDIFYLNYLFDSTQRNIDAENTVGIKRGRKWSRNKIKGLMESVIVYTNRELITGCKTARVK